MEIILGIDLGTTNSAVSIVRDGQPEVLRDEHGDGILPSVVGLGNDGKLLVGHPARNQAMLAPERTVKSIKRLMGQDTRVPLGSQSLTPQEVSAILLRSLKERAEKSLGREVRKAVITVPAFFSERQREATREAGELAGLEVVRIINEPTAATLTYEPSTQRRERLLVYDLGGGTFDVSIVQVEQGVVEVLASHGDTQLGGDDFDQLLLNDLCDQFREEHGIDLRANPVAKSRLLYAAEEAKKRLSSDVVTQVTEEFIAELDGQPLHLDLEIDRPQYEELIGHLLEKTVRCVTAALADAKLVASQIDKVILVGGSSRTPRVQQLLREQLGQEPHWEVDPDLCVSLGAAVQGGMIAGIDVGPVLVDITPHTLGVRCLSDVDGEWTDHAFSPLIQRNAPLPAARSEMYRTCYPGQDAVEIQVFQGERDDVRFNHPVGSFLLDNLQRHDDETVEIVVRFELNLDGILSVTARERATGNERKLVVENAITRFRTKNRDEAVARLSQLFGDAKPLVSPLKASSVTASSERLDPSPADASSRFPEAQRILTKTRRLAADAPADDAGELIEMAEQLEEAMADGNEEAVSGIVGKLEDILFYLEDA